MLELVGGKPKSSQLPTPSNYNMRLSTNHEDKQSPQYSMLNFCTKDYFIKENNKTLLVGLI